VDRPLPLEPSGYAVRSRRNAGEWRDYDRVEGAIRLRPERNKTKPGRVLPLVGELAGR